MSLNSPVVNPRCRPFTSDFRRTALHARAHGRGHGDFLDPAQVVQVQVPRRLGLGHVRRRAEGRLGGGRCGGHAAGAAAVAALGGRDAVDAASARAARAAAPAVPAALSGLARHFCGRSRRTCQIDHI